MENKHELTEKLKVIETEIYNAKVDLKGISLKLEMAHSYEDELLQRLEAARKNTNQLKAEFFIKSGEISEKYNAMKSIFDVFTGNFYRQP